MLKKSLLPSLLALSLSACATAVPSVEVTRFHIDNPARSGTIVVEEMQGNPDVGLEFRTYAAAVEQELQRAGFTANGGANGDRANSELIAQVGFRRSFREPERYGNDRPVSVGVGGGVGSRGFSGMGLGVGINLSGKPKGQVYTELQVQIRRRADSTVIWEGRAQTAAKEGTPAAQPGIAAQKLAAALIGGYPGESGKSITVK